MTPQPPIAADLPCAICGYNLRGLAPDADCPECGRPVARTFTPDLARSDPAWLRFQARTMLVLAAFCLINFQPFGGHFGTIHFWAGLAMAAAALAAWGCWRLGTPEPDGFPGHGQGTLHRGLRLAAAVIVLFHVGIHLREAFPAAVWTTGVLAGTACLIAATAVVALALRDFARRAGDRSLVLHARIVLWAFPLAQAGELISQFVLGVVGRLSDDGPPEWAYTLVGSLYYLLGVAAYTAVLLLGRLHEVLRAAANASAASAPAPDPAPRAPVEAGAT